MRAALLPALLAAAWLVTLPAAAAELVMVDRPGCPYCAKWDKEVGVAYPRTPESQRAPLRRLDIRQATELRLKTPVYFTPTFILLHDGQERGRITGYIDAGMFWGLLDNMLAQLDRPAPAAK